MNNWLFQGNPDHFDIDSYLANNNEITWSVRQERFVNEIKPGDQVFVWRASGKQKQMSGVVALCNVTAHPKLMDEDRDDAKYWRDPSLMKSEYRVQLSILKRNLGKREVVKRDWLVDDPILDSLRILKLANETNYLLSPEQAQRLNLLVQHTGIDWSRDECVAGLWVYNETYQKQISKLPGSPVSIVSLTIGRAVSGVYNKVMNFRAIDSRDERTGFPNANDIDRQVWDAYYDPSKSKLNEKQLREDFSSRWLEGIPTVPPKRYKDFGEAPDDDPSELSLFSRRVRKGQKVFRQNLLNAYGGACVVSGCSVEATLNAAHIYDHSESGINSIDNGLLLRSDIHDLFDAGLLEIDPDSLRILIANELRQTSYWKYNGNQISPRRDGGRPAKEFFISRVRQRLR